MSGILFFIFASCHPLKRVKIIPKWVKITPKRVKITPIGEIHSIGVIFTLFGVIFTHFRMIFTRFESDFHSVRVFLTLFTLLKSNHFTLFTLREYYMYGTCYKQAFSLATDRIRIDQLCRCDIVVYLISLAFCIRVSRNKENFVIFL